MSDHSVSPGQLARTRYCLTLVFLSVGCATHKVAPVVSPAPAPLLEIRLVQRNANGGDTYRFSDSVLYLARSPLLSDTSITSAHPSVAASGELILSVRYSPVAAERMVAVTQVNVGNQIALLVESRIVLVVPIASSVGSTGSMVINTGLTGADAERLAALVKARWPAG